jgi:hypothetical protein
MISPLVVGSSPTKRQEYLWLEPKERHIQKIINYE